MHITCLHPVPSRDVDEAVNLLGLDRRAHPAEADDRPAGVSNEQGYAVAVASAEKSDDGSEVLNIFVEGSCAPCSGGLVVASAEVLYQSELRQDADESIVAWPIKT